MSEQTLVVSQANLAQIERREESPRELAAGQIRATVTRFGLSANNISYAVVGEMLGYWAYFPAETGFGCIPVWGFATVTESRCDAIAVGERLFGYWPMGTALTLAPQAISALCFSDGSAHRLGLHPWYNRYYRCASDPAYAPATEDPQAVLWALFMTGWMMADELRDRVAQVVISSASSKTAISLAWALKRSDSAVQVVGLTSTANQAFVEGLSVYDRVLSYDAVGSIDGARSAYVDIAGNGGVTSAVHVQLGDDLVDSVTIGGTHRAPAQAPLPMPGPEPRFFFIPDVAEARAQADGFEAYHGAFAAQLIEFMAWAQRWMRLETGQGVAAVEAGYGRVLNHGLSADQALLFSWR